MMARVDLGFKTFWAKTRMMMAKVLIVEDEKDFREGLVELLELKGFEVSGVGTIAEYHAWVTQHAYDILILDRNLPDGDGIDILKNHHVLKNTGSIILSGEGQPEDRIMGIEADADYYLVKPVQVNELVAILQRLVRRLEATVENSTAQWQLSTVRWQLFTPNRLEIDLTRSEFAMLKCFVDKPGVVVTRDEIIVGLGFNPIAYDERRLEVMLRRLRKKLEDHCVEKFPLQTVYGAGFAFNEQLSAR